MGYRRDLRLLCSSCGELVKHGLLVWYCRKTLAGWKSGRKRDIICHNREEFRSIEWFQNFMRGRYSMGQPSFTLLALYLIITILDTAFRIPYTDYVALLLTIWCWFRTLSRNTYKHSQENTGFTGWIYPIQSKWRAKRHRSQDRKTHKYYNRPNYKQHLRIPEGRDTITVTCPKCKIKFDKCT